jgi:hypothetical protein
MYTSGTYNKQHIAKQEKGKQCNVEYIVSKYTLCNSVSLIALEVHLLADERLSFTELSDSGDIIWHRSKNNCFSLHFMKYTPCQRKLQIKVTVPQELYIYNFKHPFLLWWAVCVKSNGIYKSCKQELQHADMKKKLNLKNISPIQNLT